VLPLYVWSRGPVRVLRFCGHGLGAQLGPVCAPEDRLAVAAALRRLLRLLRADLLLAERMDGRAGWPGMLGARGARRISAPLVRWSGRDWDGFLAARSATLRQQVRRKERQLARAHDVRYRTADDPERLDEDLDLLFALHEARWQGGTRVFSGANGAFHRDFARQAMIEGWLRLWFLELDGRAVAAWHGFRRGGVEWYYQAGRDPRAPGSPGQVLLMRTLRAAVEEGCREYRLGPGDEPYKRRLADDDPGQDTIVMSASPAAAAGAASVQATAPRRLAQALLGA
jgi:CelD/BcsL family acetyltransferase involved in cellulose biosynthesis